MTRTARDAGVPPAVGRSRIRRGRRRGRYGSALVRRRRGRRSRTACRPFAPLGHRGEVVAETGMVRFLDDSKATNPHATLAALAGRHGVVLIAGGRRRAWTCRRCGRPPAALTAVVAIGEATGELEPVFAGVVPVRRATTIEEAVALALRRGRRRRRRPPGPGVREPGHVPRLPRAGRPFRRRRPRAGDGVGADRSRGEAPMS